MIKNSVDIAVYRVFLSYENHTLGVWFQKAYSYASKRTASFVRMNAGLPTA